MQTVATSGDGAFRFAALAAGIYDLAGNAEGFEVDAREGVAVHRAEEEIEGGAGPLFEGAEYGLGIKALSDAERAAYETRLTALARLERRAERRGEKDLDELVEWLVATAEEPLVNDQVIDELTNAVEALEKRAAEAHVSADIAAADLLLLVDRFRGSGGMLRADPRPALVGAALTADHRQRLTAALLATDGLTYESFRFYGLVARWDPAAAREWLVPQLGAPESSWDENENGLWWLSELADEIDDENLQALVSESDDRASEIEELWADDDSEEARKQRQERLVALRRDLRHRFAPALAGSS